MTDLVAPPPIPRDTLQQLLLGYRESQGIMVTARLGLADLLAGAGFRLARVLPTRSPFSILEAQRAN
ncbi:MAG TPA: hypothetical protein VGP33_09035 [Chloroflexota bacterium]|nr:hypothetical protein [Chloroflexota bacterium]